MQDPRIATLAKNLIRYSVRLQPGEKVLIDTVGYELPLTKALIRAAYQVGGQPYLNISHDDLLAALLEGASPGQIRQTAQWEAQRMAAMDAYIGIRVQDNSFALASVAQEKKKLYDQEFLQKVHYDIRVPKTKWVILRYPNAAMAQAAAMSTEAFEDFYFQVCNLDYAKMSAAMDPLVTLLNQTDRVELKGPGLDLRFSVKGVPAIKCAGECNIPDGEVYTAPVRDSINGEITYNTPSVYDGLTFQHIRFRFEKGKIVEATADSNTDQLNNILNRDAGARYVGEFAIGVNPYITEPIFDTLFDEKIRGSFHLTPGCCYDDAPNGNQSVIHWDLVHIQTAPYGGGEMYFDGRLVRKNGLFVLPELTPLNPEHLL